MSRGEPVTAVGVRGRGCWPGVRTGLVAANIRLADPAMAARTIPGDHVDLLRTRGKVVAAALAMLSVDAGSAGCGGWSAAMGSGPPGGVVVAVARDAAMRLATADHSSCPTSRPPRHESTQHLIRWPDPSSLRWLRTFTCPERTHPMLKGFKDFLMRGNVVDLAVAVVIGAAFRPGRCGPSHGPDRPPHCGCGRRARPEPRRQLHVEQRWSSASAFP